MKLVKDEWMRAAMADDRLVVELLVRLKQAHAVAPVKTTGTAAPIFPPMKWGIQQPRSRMAMRLEVAPLRKDGADSTRNSPTTPLSWSAGAGSPSDTVDGFEESRFPANRCSVNARSKGIAANEFTSSSSVKRSRKKKTFAQLKDEESLLLKERMDLKKELACMRATFNEQRARNESLKRMKIDLSMHGEVHEERSEQCANLPDQQPLDPCQALPEAARSGGNMLFVLPDLNMAPFEEDSGFEILNPVS